LTLTAVGESSRESSSNNLLHQNFRAVSPFM
jgi:hypothetical protein